MAKVCFQTHGCSTNFSESEVMMGLLKKAGFDVFCNKEDADVIVINICTVKGETTALRGIRKIKEEFHDKKLIIAGCIPKEIVPRIREISEDASLISTHNIENIVSVVDETLEGNAIEAISGEEDVKICMPKVRKNPIVGIVPILSGCSNLCSYCSVKLIKGELFSYPEEKIIEEVNRCLIGGCKEIWITSQDNAAYGLETGESGLVELLKKILSIDKKFYLRLGMMNPENVLRILNDLIEIYKNKKMFKFLHIPVQSGSDTILGLMNRNYKVDDFKKIIKKFKEQIPEITISTDIICGFPTETENQFNESVYLIRNIMPDVLNISRFIPRPGTEAFDMEQVEGGVVKNRSRLVTDIFNNIARMRNEKWLNWQGNILIDEKGKNSSWVGRNAAYKPIVVEGNLKLGDVVKVEVNSIAPNYLKAKCL